MSASFDNPASGWRNYGTRNCEGGCSQVPPDGPFDFTGTVEFSDLHFDSVGSDLPLTFSSDGINLDPDNSQATVEMFLEAWEKMVDRKTPGV